MTVLISNIHIRVLIHSPLIFPSILVHGGTRWRPWSLHITVYTGSCSPPPMCRLCSSMCVYQSRLKLVGGGGFVVRNLPVEGCGRRSSIIIFEPQLIYRSVSPYGNSMGNNVRCSKNLILFLSIRAPEFVIRTNCHNECGIRTNIFPLGHRGGIFEFQSANECFIPLKIRPPVKWFITVIFQTALWYLAYSIFGQKR
jgi:hypothetical protein